VVVLAVDGDGALGSVEGGAAGRLLDVGHVEGVGLLDHRLVEVERGVRRLHRVGGGLVLAVRRLVGRDELLVLRAVDGLVVVPGGELALEQVGAHRGDLLLGDRHRDHRCLGEALVEVALEEGHVGVAVDGVEDRVGLGRDDLLDGRTPLGLTELLVLLADDLDVVGGRPLLDLVVGRAREDVVGPDQEERLDVLLGLQVLQARQDLLVGRRAGVEDVRRRLETLVLDGVEEQVVEALEDRQHRLARRGGPAAEDRRDAVGLDELLGLLREDVRLGGAVLLDDLELLAVDAASGVDLVGGHLE
jgi:hypothetical protein